jgi:hypothetical protein
MKCVMLCVFALQLPLAYCQETEESLASARQRLEALDARDNVRFDAMDSDCYQRFAVNHCLDQVRQMRIEAHAALKREEVKIHDAERRLKAMQALRQSQEKVEQKAAQDAQAPFAASHASELTRKSMPVPASPGVSASRAIQSPDEAQLQQRRKDYAARQAEADRRRGERDSRLRKPSAVPSLPLPP